MYSAIHVHVIYVIKILETIICHMMIKWLCKLTIDLMECCDVILKKGIYNNQAAHGKPPVPRCAKNLQARTGGE